MQINLFMLLLCCFAIFVLGFTSFKPALLHNESDYKCAPRSWCSKDIIYEFPQLITHKYTASNIIAGIVLILLIILIMFVGNRYFKSFIKDKERLKA